MNQNHSDPSEEIVGLLERLACGDLDEPSRGRVLRWLEEEPARWRLCGVAFLEAQTWSQALERSPVPEPWAATPNVKVADRPSRVDQRPRRPIVRRPVMAVLLLAAFGLGMAVHNFGFPAGTRTAAPIATDGTPSTGSPRPEQDDSREAASGEAILAEVDVQAGGRFGAQAPVRIPVVPADQGAGDDNGVDIPEYLKQQWERRGYKVSLERRYVFARLPDGQKVAVPVEKFHVNPVRLSMN